MFNEPVRRRRRRSRRWLVPLALIVLIALALAIGGSRSDTRRLVAYLDTAREVAESQEAAATTFRTLIIRDVDRLDRADLTRLLDNVVASIDEDAAMLEETPPPEAALVAAGLELALDAWRTGVVEFRDALFAAADAPDDPSVVDTLTEALVELRVGDRAYVEMLQELEELGGSVDVAIGRFPRVAYSPTGSLSISFAPALVERITASGALTAMRDLAVTALQFDPNLTGGERDGLPVIPATAFLTVRVVVTNEGTTLEEQVELTIVASRRDAPNEGVHRDQAAVARLDPGASTTVEFAGIPVDPGNAYRLVVAVTVVDGEAETDDNVRTREFFVNERS